MGSHRRTSTVDYIYFDPERARLLEYGVCQKEMLSDHQLVWAEFDAMVERPPEQNRQYKTWKLLRLKDEAVVKKYQVDFCKRHALNFREQCRFAFEDQAELDSCFEATMGYVLDSARQIIGESDRTKFIVGLGLGRPMMRHWNGLLCTLKGLSAWLKVPERSSAFRRGWTKVLGK